MDPIVRRLLENKLREEATPDEQYEEYITKHRQGVEDVYKEIMKPLLIEEGVDEEILAEIQVLVETHDASKYGKEEWEPYRDHFYDPEKNPKSGSVSYDHAWNHHQKSNPHHWQYWCLINDVDSPQVQPLDMPLQYIIEMLCDWQSAGNHYGNTAYDWYSQQKDKMILSENTRNIVEKYIEYFK